MNTDLSSDFVLSVKSEDATKFLAELGKEFPKAAAIALNRTAEDVLAAQRQHIREAFMVRVPGFILPPQRLPREWRATPAQLSAFIALGPEFDPIAKKRRNILEPFEKGEPKRMRKYPVAIPTGYIRPTWSSSVPRKLYPRNLIGIFNKDGILTGMGTKARFKTRKYKTKSGVKTSSKSVGRYFTLGGSADRFWGLYERVGKGRIRRLWTFRTGVPRPRRLEFVPIAMRVVGERWPVNAQGVVDLFHEIAAARAAAGAK
jgi:hypothetical protein